MGAWLIDLKNARFRISFETEMFNLTLLRFRPLKETYAFNGMLLKSHLASVTEGRGTLFAAGQPDFRIFDPDDEPVITIERYFAPALVCQQVCLALTPGWLWSRRPGWGRVAGGLVGTMPLGTAILYFAWPPYPPWREMAASVATHRGKKEAVVAVERSAPVEPFCYYLGEEIDEGGSVIRVDFYAMYPLTIPEDATGVWFCLSRRQATDVDEKLLMAADRARFPVRNDIPIHRGQIIRRTPASGD